MQQHSSPSSPLFFRRRSFFTAEILEFVVKVVAVALVDAVAAAVKVVAVTLVDAVKVVFTAVVNVVVFVDKFGGGGGGVKDVFAVDNFKVVVAVDDFLGKFISCSLIGSHIIESAVYCNQILLVLLHLNIETVG